jgi:tetratricopeptide (TPR) repeat protein
MIFIKLAEMGADSLDTRRRATFSELITHSTDTSTIDVVLGILTDARLVTTGTLEPGDTRVVEVAHEALIREWPTLRDWLNQNREGLILHRQLTEDTNDWLKLGRDSGALYRGVRLNQTLEWVKTDADLISLAEQEFLDASQKTARKEAGQTQRLVRARWIQALLVIIIVGVILAVTNAFAPRVMPDGTFNIAVAEFGEMDSNGEIQASKAGQLMSGWAVTYLRTELKKDDPNLVIWPNESSLFTKTSVELVQPDTAEQTASDINADLLLYGYIDTRSDPPQLVLSFWVAPQDEFKFEDIQGSTQIGKPIRVVNLNDPGVSVRGELERQSTAVAFIAMGLAQEQLGQSQDALAAFLKAEESAPQSEMVQFFIGREYLVLAELQPGQQEDFWQKAEDAFLKSIDINDQFPRAYLGLGSVYMKRSAELLDTAIDSEQTVDPLAIQLMDQTIEAYQKVLELKDDPGLFGNPVKDVARTAMGNAYRQKGEILFYQGELDSALNAFDEAIRLLEISRLAFEASVAEHESYRRYLAQTYEYLGTVYLSQVSIFEYKLDFDQALPIYQSSINAFNQCVSQGANSPDLVIQDDIVGKYCQPKLEEVQQRHDELVGGN